MENETSFDRLPPALSPHETFKIQSSALEKLRPDLESGGDFTRYPPLPGLQAKPEIQAPAAVRLPWSKVVYHSFRDNNTYCEIYIANDDGTGLVRLTNNSKTDISPRLNRGGTKIVYVSGLYNSSGSYEIYTINPNGTSNTRLTNNSQNDNWPSWSPDGSKIAFQSYRDGNAEIYIMNADGSGQIRLTNDANYDGQPTWSPDGTKIAWTAYRGGAYRIWVMNSNGSGAMQLSGQPYSEGPAYSPDGTQIAYDSDANGDGWQEIWLMNADGSNQHVVYTPASIPQDAYVYSWSPDGTYIIFTHVYYIYQNGSYYWSDAYLRMVSPITLPGVETELLGGNLNWWPHWQTLDAIAPTSAMQPLPVQSPGPIQVSWNGSDTGGAGLKSFDIQVRDGAGGTWTDWLSATQATSGSYPGLGGHTYFFRSRVRDNAFNLEAWPADYDVLTTVEALPPASSVISLPEYSPSNVKISWSGSDPGGSGVRAFDVQFKIVTHETEWIDWQMNTSQTSATYSGPSGITVAFRARAIDNAQNQEAWPIDDREDTKTILVSFGLQGKVMDNTGNPVAGAVVAANPTPFQNPPSSLIGSYGTFVNTGESTVTVNWSKSGYGTLPQTMFSVPSVGQLDVTLPPADNVIANPALEFTGAPEAPWLIGGVVTPVTVITSHTGNKAVRLGVPSTDVDNLSNLEQPPYLPETMDMIVEGNGYIHAIWTYDDIHYARRDGAGNWSTPVNVSQGVTVASREPPQMVLAGDGTLFVLWSNPGAGQVNFAQRTPAGIWSGPIPFSSGSRPRIALDNNGILHIAWAVADNIYYTQRSTAGTWATPVVVYPSSFRSFRMAVDGTGIANVAVITYGGSLVFTRRSLGGDWSSPQELDPFVYADFGGATYYDIKTDSAGNCYFAWENGRPPSMGNPDISYLRRYSDGSWSTPVILSQTTGTARFPQIALGSGNSVHVFWVTQSFTEPWANLSYAFQPDGGAWSTPEYFPHTYNYVLDLSVVTDPQGGMQIAWLESAGQAVWGLFCSKKLAGGWTQPQQIFSGTDYSGEYTKISLDDKGAPYIAWITKWFQGNAMIMGPRYAPTSGSSYISQTVSLTSRLNHPVLSFWYKLGDVSAANNARFEIQVTHSGITDTLFSTNANTSVWKHQWLDLTAYADQEIIISFHTYQTAGSLTAYTLIDDVTIGSASPDIWVGGAGSGTALPSGTNFHSLVYGNQGIVPVENVKVTATLPDELTFVSANPEPTTINGQTLTWNIGALPGSSGPFTIQVTADVSVDAILYSTLDGSLKITKPTNELLSANNTAQTHIWIGAKVLMPVIAR